MKNKSIYTLLFILFSFTAFSQSFNKPKMDSLFAVLAEKNKAMGTIAISKNGQLIYSNSIGYASIDPVEKIPATAKTKYRIGSITKMFTAILIFQLIEEKKLSLDSKLDKYFPSVPNAAKISIGNLLNHHSGLHNFTDDSLYLTYNQKPKTQKEMIAIIAASPVDFEPGAKGEYSNTNFVLLGYIAENISGKTYSKLIKQRITDKLGLTDTYVGGKADAKNNESYSYSFINTWKQEPETDLTVPAGAGSIVSTPAGLVKFIEGLFAGKLISAASLEQAMKIKDRYGMGILQIPFYNRKAWGHNGGVDGFGSSLCYFREDSVAIAYCTNGQVYPMNDILIGILSIYFNMPYKIPLLNNISVSSSDLDKYLGIYSSEKIPLKITVTKENSTLIAQASGQQSFPLEATEKDIFKFDRAGVVMEFNPEKKEFILKQGGVDYLFTKDQ